MQSELGIFLGLHFAFDSSSFLQRWYLQAIDGFQHSAQSSCGVRVAGAVLLETPLQV
jgi:hypothetical protein